MITGEITKERMEKWKIVSPEEKGFYEVITPIRNDCQQTFIYRLNLKEGEEFLLNPSEISKDSNNEYIGLELNAILIKGKASVTNEIFSEEMDKLDSFYITKDIKTRIRAISDCIFYIGGAIDEGYGKSYYRKFDLSLPIGDIHQIHGKKGTSGEREVFMTCGPEVEASRLLAGITWSGDGTWTSWPPHQHEKELEEVYCYFDVDAPRFGMQLSYVTPGDIDNIVVHTVNSGVFCMAPRGYHPTAASPGSRNAYVWIMCAHSHENRRYDLAVSDPTRAEITECKGDLKDKYNF